MNTIGRTHHKQISAIETRVKEIKSYTLHNGFVGASVDVNRFDAIIAEWKEAFRAKFTTDGNKATIYFHSNHWVEMTLA